MRGQLNLGQNDEIFVKKLMFPKMLGMASPGVENDSMLRAMLLKLSRASQLPYKAKIQKSKENIINLINFIIFPIPPYFPNLGSPPFNRPPSATL